ncbi:MAG: hypothetical protein ACI9YE_000399 [Psychroserpens sp.]|jgi:hypothetical protein
MSKYVGLKLIPVQCVSCLDHKSPDFYCTNHLQRYDITVIHSGEKHAVLLCLNCYNDGINQGIFE